MITTNRIQGDDICVKAMYKQFRQVCICFYSHLITYTYTMASCNSKSFPFSSIFIICIVYTCYKVQLSTRLSDLATIFDRDYYALVVAEQKCYQKGVQTTRSVVAGVVTRIDLLNYIMQGQDAANDRD